MSKLLARYKINYILLQIIVITFLCIMSFVNFFIDRNLEILRLGLQTFSLLVFLVYEVIIHFLLNRARRNKVVETKVYNEQFLWYNLLILLDILLLVYIIYNETTTMNVNIAFFIVIGFVVYYFLSLVARPYFGIHIKK